MLGIRLDKELEQRLEHLVEQTGHTKSYYAKKALKTYLDDYEDYLYQKLEIRSRSCKLG